MMQVNGVTNGNVQPAPVGGVQATDAVSKNIQMQIMDAQKKLQDLSSNQELTMEEKMQKRQELQKQISDLNNQLRQHQIDLRQEKKDEQKEAEKPVMPEEEESKASAAADGMSERKMEAMVSADSAIQHAKSIGGIQTTMEGASKVLQTEMEQDSGRGISSEAKQAAVDDLEKRLDQVIESRSGNLAKASDDLESASREELQEKKNPDGQGQNVPFQGNGEPGTAAFFRNLQAGKRAAVGFSEVDFHI